MEKLFIPILLGTAREGRRSERAARFVLGEAQMRDDVHAELVDIREHLRDRTLGPDNPGGADTVPTAWKGIMAKADGLIIVTPEYNHGYPGELKLLLDSLGDEYEKKPLGLVGCGGLVGGSRAVEQLRLVALELHMLPIPTALYFTRIKTQFRDDGALVDETYRERAGHFLDEISWYARVLKGARGNA